MKNGLFAFLAGLFSLFAAVSTPAYAFQIAEWSPLLNNIDELVQGNADNTLFVRSGDRWYKLSVANNSLRKDEVEGPAPYPKDQFRMPDGFLATAPDTEKADIVNAWYSVPTDNYTHSALGDALEGSMLKATLSDGTVVKTQLGLDMVFEDRSPRVVDLDGDGRMEIVTIRTKIIWGAQVAVYGYRRGTLQELAVSEPMGRIFRWLNIAGIEDYDGDGVKDIAIVRMPHLRGDLQFLKLKEEHLVPFADAKGFSNHKLGELAMSLSTTIKGPQNPILILPSFSRKELRAVAFKDGQLRTIWSYELSEGITGGVAHLNMDGGTLLFVATEKGDLIMKFEDKVY